MAQRPEVLSRDAEDTARKIDGKIKNKWKWTWIEAEDVNGDYYSEYIRKINVPGTAICTTCNEKQINYSTSGRSRPFIL